MSRRWQRASLLAALCGCLMALTIQDRSALGQGGINRGTCNINQGCSGCTAGYDAVTMNPVDCSATTGSYLVCSPMGPSCNPQNSSFRCSGIGYPVGSGCMGMQMPGCYTSRYSCQ